MAEPFKVRKATEISGVTIFKSFKMGLIFFAICGIAFCIYVAVIKPHFNPIKTQEQKADKITNITQVKTEEAFELSVFPPKLKIGGFKLKIFDFK